MFFKDLGLCLPLIYIDMRFFVVNRILLAQEDRLNAGYGAGM